jgi:rhodanese-related sulfurtransferase
MKNCVGNFFLEIAAIILLASIVGLIWNHEMLYAVWSGKSFPVQPPPVSTGSAELPQPAGLAQVKYLYDRKEAVFVDARSTAAFAADRIKGAVSLPLGQLAAKFPEFKREVPSSDTLVVYCNGYGCDDSMKVGKQLMSNGYRHVLLFEGGYPEWKDAGYPLEGERQ